MMGVVAIKRGRLRERLVVGLALVTLPWACHRPPLPVQIATPASAPAPASKPPSTQAVGSFACVEPLGNHVHVPSPPPGPTVRPPTADHVIILSEDGLRPDALKEAGAPHHEMLMRGGAFTLHARTIRRASTLPSHAAMLSGFDVEEHGLFWNSWHPERGFIKVPTVLSVAMNAGKGSAAFVGKWKLQHIAFPGGVDVFSRPGYLCKKVVDEAAAYFVAKRPQALFVHFSDPDEEGHSAGWMSEPQFKAIRSVDQCLETLLDAVKRSQVADRTLLIISADHGGHGRNHSGAIDEDRLIPWIAWGAGVRPGHRIVAPVSTMDTAATALWALGYEPARGAAGRPVSEAFR